MDERYGAQYRMAFCIASTLHDAKPESLEDIDDVFELAPRSLEIRFSPIALAAPE